ncbi:MAG TPA: histidine kinase N-terminal 7TM domain-containing protein [Anaerolineales bacterium]|nr:histidine kinase N-terminal 7TM domain-containing protein [Anaerolineales bacterium]
MSPPNTYYSAFLFLTGIACLVVAAIVWQQRRAAAGAGALIVFMLTLSWWDISYAIFGADAPGPTPFFWLDITYVSVVLAPTAFLAFTLQFVQREHWLKPPFIFVLAIEPMTVLALLWTDPWHNLFFAGKRDSNTQMILDGGPVFWANVIYSYTLLLISSILLVQFFRRSSGLFRRQAATVLGAAAIPWLNSIIFVSRLNPLPDVDNTPFAFSFAALAFAYALLRYRLLDVKPIARHVLVENMSDGVIVLDAQNRIVDINPAALSVLGVSAALPIGQPVEKVLSAWPDLVTTFYEVQQVYTEIAVGHEPYHYLDLRISPLFDRGQFVGRLIVWRDITGLKRAQAELQRLATTDVLTQVFNRRYFLEMADRELKRALRLKHPLALVLMDIDRFKDINDTFGHAAGDQVLITFAKVCQANIREIDLLARFGGEEFAALMPESGHEQAYLVAERLRLAVAQAPTDFDGHQISITSSFGIATVESDRDTLEVVLRRADQALYAAKQAGRNRVVAWQQSLSTTQS